MGVKGLIQYVKKLNSNVVRTLRLHDLRGMKLACDALQYLYKYKSVEKYSASKNHGGYVKHYLEYFINLIKCLVKHDIDVTFVFDGKAPSEKDKTRLKRKTQKENIISKAVDYKSMIEELGKKSPDIDYVMDLMEKVEKKRPANELEIPPVTDLNIKYQSLIRQVTEIKPVDIKNVKTLLQCLGIPYLTADGEGEKLCAQMAIDGDVNACLTSDSDVLAYGCPFYITDVNSAEETCSEIELDDVINILKFDGLTQLRDFCILCGTDYNDNIPKMGPVTSHKLLLECKDIDGMVNKLGESKFVDLNYKTVRNLFDLENSKQKVTPERIRNSEPDRDAFNKFMRSLNIRISTDYVDELFEKLDARS
jgi:5'-3' exonuclease